MLDYYIVRFILYFPRIVLLSLYKASPYTCNLQFYNIQRLKSFLSEIVLMGKNVACKVIGEGIVQLKMYDGMIRTLTDVRHVPDLKRKLISYAPLKL